MKAFLDLRTLLSFGVAIAISALLLGQAAGGGGRGGGGGGGRMGATGTPGIGAPAIDLYAASSSRGGAYSDLELTALTRMDEQVAKEASAAKKARDALEAEIYVLPRDPSEIQARVGAVANAELDLALARSDAFAAFRQRFTVSPAQREALVNQSATGTLNGRGSGGIGIGGSRPPTPPGPVGTE